MDYILQMLAKTDWPVLVGVLAMFYFQNKRTNKKFEKFEEKWIRNLKLLIKDLKILIRNLKISIEK